MGEFGDKVNFKISRQEIQKGLDDLVSLGILIKSGVGLGKFQYTERYLDILKLSKPKKSQTVEEVLIEVIWKMGFFSKPRTEKEIFVVIRLLSLVNDKQIKRGREEGGEGVDG